MEHRKICKAKTKSGDPCKLSAVSETGFCRIHAPERDRHQTGSSNGGKGKATVKGAAMSWASSGEVIALADLPGILLACIIAVRDEEMTPSQAKVILELAKTSASLQRQLDMDTLLLPLEDAADFR